MKKYSFSLVLSIMLFLTNSSFCQDENTWTLVAENDNYKVYLNKDSVKFIGESRTDYDVWLKWECKTECNDGYKSIEYSIQNWNLFCEKKEFNVPKTIDHYKDGEENVYTSTTVSPVMENSPGEKVLNYFCEKKE